MDSFREWEEPQVQGKAVGEEAFIADYPTTSFTSLNPRKAPEQYIHPKISLRYPTFQSEASIYDIPADDDDHPVKKVGERPNPARQDFSYSIESVWQYTDEDDPEFQRDFVPEGNAPKRRKSMPAKKTKAKKTPFKMQVLDVDDEEHTPSQLATPPDSGKKGIKKTTTSKKIKERLPVFKNLTITKPMQAEEKGKIAETTPPVISYQGWTATQDAVKSDYNGIAKTTLDKLATFRYKASSQSQHVDPPQAPQSQASMYSAHVDTEYESGGGYFQQAASNTKLEDRFEEICPKIDQSSPRPENRVPEERNVIFVREREVTTGRLSSEPRQGGTVTEIIPLFPQQLPATTPSLVVSSYLQLTYNETRDLESQLNVADAREDGEVLQGKSQRLEMPSAFVRGLQRIMANQFDYHSIRSQVDTAESLTGADDANTTLIADPVELDISDPKEGLVYSSAPVSELEDEYDDGIADADLLAITDNVQPHLKLRVEQNLNILPVQVSPRSNLPTSVLADNHAKLTTVRLQPPPPIFIDSDEDMFPMEAGVEEGMIDLCEQQNQVIERFQAPASLQISVSDAKSRDRELFDCSLQFSPPNSKVFVASPKNLPAFHPIANTRDSHSSHGSRSDPLEVEEEDWSFIGTHRHSALVSDKPLQEPSTSRQKATELTMSPEMDSIQGPTLVLDDSHEYNPLERFLRPEFPDLVRDRCPIVGVSAQTFLRTCFRIGEMFREGTRCQASGQDAIIELFARVTFSSRESDTLKQQFQFADLWSDKPPYPTGILPNYKMTALQDRDGSVFLENDTGKMSRCLGRLKKDKKSNTGWILNIINIRETDWEEIRWTKRILTAGIQGATSSKP